MIYSLLTLLLALLFVDILAFRGLRILFGHPRLRSWRRLASGAWWAIDGMLLVFLVVYGLYLQRIDPEVHVRYRMFFWIKAAVLLVFLPKAGMFLFTVLYFVKRFVLKYGIGLMLHPIGQRLRLTPAAPRLQRIRRSRILPLTGLLASALLFSFTLHGIGIGRFDFRVERVPVFIESLPEAFEGYRIVQISDTHLGSFTSTSEVEKALGIIAGLDPDLIVFTGDMVNNHASEAEPFVSLFAALQARDGKFSVLGNHDMGDYRSWGTIQKPDPRIATLVDLQQQMGFRVLRNEHVFIYRGQDSLLLAGVDNWGLPPFIQAGDLAQALGDMREHPLSILLSHDPSHWRAQVIPQTNINLSLSGHTHGMQMGIYSRFFSWSPVSIKYNEWNGLYQEGKQQLYVNRGFGYLSFPMRISMPPEITLITLHTPPVI